MKTIATMIVAALALTLQGGFVSAHANSTSGHCTGMTVTDFVSSDVNDGTSSTTWVNITDGHLNFTSSATGCVAITFSGVVFVSPPNPSDYEYVHVRTLLDGRSLCAPALASDDFLGAGLPSPVTAASITRVCKNVAPGPHTVQVQFSVNSSSGSSNMAGHVLTVTHN